MELMELELERISRRYPNAPIVEAIIEIRVNRATEFTHEQCKTVFDSVKDEFPTRKELLTLRASVSGGTQVGASAVQRPEGFQLLSGDNLRIVTATPERFTFSRLAPYESWDSFRSDAHRMWTIYRSHTNPASIVRIATRFVNKIDVPLPIDVISEYFRTGPEMSDDMSQDLSGFFMQLQLPQKKYKCMAILNEALLEPVREGFASFALDIDVFDERTFILEDEVWERLDTFRWCKNEIFEACITDKTRSLFS